MIYSLNSIMFLFSFVLISSFANKTSKKSLYFTAMWLKHIQCKALAREWCFPVINNLLCALLIKMWSEKFSNKLNGRSNYFKLQIACITFTVYYMHVITLIQTARPTKLKLKNIVDWLFLNFLCWNFRFWGTSALHLLTTVFNNSEIVSMLS